MSDTRLTLIGVGLVFAGFLVLGIFGSAFFALSAEAQEFSDCYEYSEERAPVPVSCEAGLYGKAAFFSLVVGIIATGVFMLVLGARGDWDQRVRPEEMTGPGFKDDSAKR